jgi:N-acetylglutamate synthase-like GNAT family acetyltransferase
MKVTKRRLTSSEAEIISQEIARTPNIIGYLAKELLRMDDVLVIEGDKLIGMLAYVDAAKFIDLKLLIIREKCRGKGYGEQLFNSFIERTGRAAKPVYTVTKSEAVIYLVKKAGFKQIRIMQLPWRTILHQSKMIFSICRAKEFVSKSRTFPREADFLYWIKYQ